jgi:hypothetical protein
MDGETNVTLSLTHDQALVLFDWLSREDGKKRIPVEHQAEQEVLWVMEAQLERALVEPLAADYDAAVSAARQRLVP